MVFGLIAAAISGVVGAISAIGSSILGLGVGPFLGIVNLAIGIAKLLSPKNQIEPRDYERFSYTANIKDKKPENYENVSSYISDVKDSMKELTPEEEQNLSETEKKRYKSNTIATIFQAFGEELGLKEPISFGAIKGAAEIKMNPTEFKKMVEDYKNNKIPTMDVDAYLDNKLDADDDIAMYNYLKEKLDKMEEASLN